MARIFLVALLLATAIFAQTGGAPEDEAAIVNPPDIDFQIRTPDGQSVFRMGERIVIETLVSSRSPGKYRLATGGCSSNSWNSAEGVSVDPPDAALNSAHDEALVIGGSVGSCLSGLMELTEVPFVISIELSPEMRFARPGTYQIRVTSKRASEGEDDDPWSMVPKIPLVSPPLPLTIVEPDAEWVAGQLSQAVQTLDADSPEAEKIQAVRTLRRLGTPEAVSEMLRRIDGKGGLVELDIGIGLALSRHQAIAAAGLEALVTSLDRPITAFLLQSLVAIEISRRRSAGELASPNDFGGRWNVDYEIRREYELRLSRSVMRKELAARATSLVALLEMGQFPTPGRSAPHPGSEEFRPALAEVFHLLPMGKQAELLLHQWERIRHPDLLPHMLETIQRPALPVANQGRDEEWLRYASFRRVGDLDPSLGRRVVTEEVRKAELTVEVDALVDLPYAELPEMDETLVERFAAPTEYYERSAAARLIERYATARIFESVKEAYGDRDDQDCPTQRAILGYFLRVDPEFAVERIRQSVQYRPESESYCRESILETLRLDARRSDLEPVVSALLNDPEPIVAAWAANWLGQIESDSAREALWDRLSSWSEMWRGREAELRELSRQADHRMRPDQLETALLQALGVTGRHYANEAKLSRIRALCVTKRCLDMTVSR